MGINSFPSLAGAPLPVLSMFLLVIRPCTKWFSDEIRKAKQNRRTAERRWRSSKLQIRLELFRQEKLKTNKLIASCKAKHLQETVKNHQNDPKHLSQILQGLIRHEPEKRPLPQYENIQTLAEQFSTYFCDKISTIRKDLEKGRVDISDPQIRNDHTECTLQCFHQTTEEEIIKVVKESANKTCPLDAVPTWLIKECADVLAPAMTSIVNTSLKPVKVHISTSKTLEKSEGSLTKPQQKCLYTPSS